MFGPALMTNLSFCSASFSRMSLSSCAFECRSVSDFSGGIPRPDGAPFYCKLGAAFGKRPFLTSSLILKFSPRFVRRLSNKARRNYSNIGTAQIVATSSSDYNQPLSLMAEAAKLINSKNKNRFSLDYELYRDMLEEKISELEGAQSTILLASGTCAHSVIILALVQAGGHIIMTTDCYRKAIILVETVLPRLGITASIIDHGDYNGLQLALDKHKVSIFFTESPTNPFLRCVDIELVSKLCHSKGAILCIDGTSAMPLNQKALAFGADIVVQSPTNYTGGQNDVRVGSVSGSTELISRIRNLHPVLGGTISPYYAYLLVRGMKTLKVRAEHQNLIAEQMAKVLDAHPKVKHVYYPGLPNHPEHHIAKKQMIGFGSVVSFEVNGDFVTTSKFVGALKIPYGTPVFGGCLSVVDQPVLLSYWGRSQSDRSKFGINDNLVRITFGLDSYLKLENDIMEALDLI